MGYKYRIGTYDVQELTANNLIALGAGGLGSIPSNLHRGCSVMVAHQFQCS